MAGELAAIAGVGFRHVVEDGLAVLEGRRSGMGVVSMCWSG